jgi:hypothetical protein
MKAQTGKLLRLPVIGLAILSFVCSAFGRASVAVDLSLRRAIYLTSSKTAIDLKNDKYVAANNTIKVKKSDAVSCQGDKCIFNLGIIAFRSEGRGTLRTYGQFTGKTLGIVGNTIIFNDGEKTKQHVLPVTLVVGSNVITFTVDPNKQTAETDENNNSVDVRIVVEP